MLGCRKCVSWRTVVSHIAAVGGHRGGGGSLGTPVLCCGNSLHRGMWELILSVKTLEEGRFSDIILHELIIRPEPFSAVAQGGTQKVVSRPCCLQIEPRLKNILKLEVWLKKVSSAVKHERTCLAP